MTFCGPFKTYDSCFMENIEKCSIRNEFAFTAYCMFPVFFFLHYRQGHSHENKILFFPQRNHILSIDLLHICKLPLHGITVSF